MAFQIRRPVLLVGEAGTSKTATIMQYLRNLNPNINVIDMRKMRANRAFL